MRSSSSPDIGYRSALRLAFINPVCVETGSGCVAGGRGGGLGDGRRAGCVDVKSGAERVGGSGIRNAFCMVPRVSHRSISWKLAPPEPQSRRKTSRTADEVNLRCEGVLCDGQLKSDEVQKRISDGLAGEQVLNAQDIDHPEESNLAQIVRVNQWNGSREGYHTVLLHGRWDSVQSGFND
jgi:hypothetical protein